MTTDFHGFRAEIRDGVLVVTFEGAAGRPPVVGVAMLRGLEELLRETDAREDLTGVLFRGRHPGPFLLGPDAREIEAIEDAYRGAELARLGQAVFQRVRQLPVPAVCAIEGPCLGAGAELTLACRHVVVSDSPAVVLGFPQVELGILPAFGGTQRLPRRVGLRAASDLLLSGRKIGAAEARKLGLVDRVVSPGLAFRAASSFLAKAREEEEDVGGSPGRAATLLRTWERVGPLRRIALYPARQRAAGSATPDQAPAERAILEAVEAAFALPLPQGLDLEARLAGELVSSRAPKNLIRLALDRKAIRQRDPGARPRPLRKLAVAGAGERGRSVASLAADAGIPVRLFDPDGEALLAALAGMRTRGNAAVRRGALTPAERDRAEALLSVSTHFSGFTRASLVVEAIPENVELKHRLVAELERTVPEATVIATSTRSIPVTAVASRSMRPERIVGLQLFDPVRGVDVVEVIVGERTSPEAVATARAAAMLLGKTPVVVRDRPGFLVNRVRLAYLEEALRILSEGVPVGLVDDALVRFGMAEGPFAALDRIGLDRARQIAADIDAPGPDSGNGPPAVLDAMIAAGRTGERAGAGFYRYRDGRRTSPARETYNLVGITGSRPLPAETVEERLVLTLVREAAACLEDRVVDAAGDVDVAMAAAGFPAFRGGPLRHADALGLAAVVDRLERLADGFGERFRPVEILRSPPGPGGSFHPAESPPGPGVAIATGSWVD